MHLQTSLETHLQSGDNGSKSLITLPSGRQLQTRPLGVANHFRDFCLLDSCWQQPRTRGQKAKSRVAGLLARKPTDPCPPSVRGLESGDQDNQPPTAHSDPTPKATLVPHGASAHKGGREGTVRNQEGSRETPWLCSLEYQPPTNHLHFALMIHPVSQSDNEA